MVVKTEVCGSAQLVGPLRRTNRNQERLELQELKDSMNDGVRKWRRVGN